MVMPDGVISFHVLRPVDVRVDELPLRIAAPGQRALLAQLLLQPDQTVAPATLIDGIWGNEPPKHPDSALHVVVCRLRRALGSFAPLLVRDHAGYRMALDASALDLARAQEHAAQARRAADESRMADAAAGFDAALACWSGEPLSDLAEFPFYDAADRRLRTFELELVEHRNEAYLRCGRHLDILKDIDVWVAREPWRERLCAHQMIALYAAGRQIEALAAYDKLRRLLADDFGVEPNTELQDLQRSILRHDPALLATLEEVAALYHEPPRDESLEELVERMRRVAGPSRVIIVDDAPGGKSWVVVQIDGGFGARDDAERADVKRRTLSESLERLDRRIPDPSV
jgi:DNA-binding SARP family transcriptional activator